MPDSPSIRLFAVGFSERNQSALEMMLSGPGKGRYTIVDEEPEVGLVDIDGVGGQTLLEAFRRERPDVPVIALSVRRPGLDGVSYVSKPVRIDELLRALRLVLEKGDVYVGKSQTDGGPAPAPVKPKPSVAAPPDGKPHLHLSAAASSNPAAEAVPPLTGGGTMPPTDKTPTVPDVDLFDDKRPAYAASLAVSDDHVEKVCGRHEDIDLADPKQVASRRFSRRNTLLDYVEAAVERTYRERVPIEIGGLFKPIYVLYNGHVMAALSNNALRSTSIVQLDDAITRLRPIGVEELRTRTKNKPLEYHHEAIESFLWKIALWTARGRLPEHADLGGTFRITRWPNLTRDELFPYAFPIAALAYEGPQTIEGICQTLDIPQRYVFSFYSAADAVGIIERSAETAAAPSHAHVSASRQNLLRSVLGRIGF